MIFFWNTALVLLFVLFASMTARLKLPKRNICPYSLLCSLLLLPSTLIPAI